MPAVKTENYLPVPGRPTEFAERLVKALQDPINWKKPTMTFNTWDKKAADEVAYALDFYMGGHETRVIEFAGQPTIYSVSCQGYYHYVGA